MKSLASWVQTPLAGAVGWTLLHSLWQGAAIAAALAAVLLALRSPRARYAAACGAMLLMLGAFGLTLARVMPGGAPGLRPAGPPVIFAWDTRGGMGGGSGSNAGLTAAVPWLAPFWMAGVWIFYLGQAAGWVSVRRLRRRGVCCAPERWQQELARLSVRLRLSRPVLLLESCLAEAPVVLGHFRPVVLVPLGLLAGWPAEQVEAILLHELAHIRRCDYLVNIVQRAVEGLLFYHPAAWWISRVIRTERENCCDDVVVATSGKAHEYAAALAALEGNRYSAAVAATGGTLVQRVRRLLGLKVPNGAWTPLVASLALLATAAVALAAWQAERPQSPGAERRKETAGQRLEAEQAAAESRAAQAEASARVEMLTRQLKMLRRQLTDSHPDVRQLEVELAAAKSRAAQAEDSARVAMLAQQLKVLRRQYTDSHPKVLQLEAELAAAEKAGPYLKWLNEDVVYIIENREREAFKKLTTDEERQKFIEQFWLRRDPTPGTERNEFKEEHYRRIAYANEHFASGIPGWKTDRGRIYIVYGPPDEIEAHPGGTQQRACPWEIWMYRHIEGIGDRVTVTFFDREGTGDYRMGPGNGR